MPCVAVATTSFDQRPLVKSLSSDVSAHQPVTLRLPSDVSLCVSTSRHSWRPADFDWTPPRPRWRRWVLHNSWRKSTFWRFRWCRHVSTSRRQPVTSASSSTASWRCLHMWPPCVAVATTSNGSSDRSSDRCHLTPSRRWSRRSFRVAWTTATRCCVASSMVCWASCSLFRMRLHVWGRGLDAMTT